MQRLSRSALKAACSLTYDCQTLAEKAAVPQTSPFEQCVAPRIWHGRKDVVQLREQSDQVDANILKSLRGTACKASRELERRR